MDLSGVFCALRAGLVSSLSSEDLSRRISECVRGTAESPSDTDHVCVCVSLTESIISRLTAHTLPADASAYYDDVIRRLFGEMNLMTELLSLLRCEDQLVSHLSAKCLSVFIIHDVCVSGGSAALWTQACAKVLDRSSSSAELISSLWTLTAVIKGMMRGDTPHRKTAVLSALLCALDSSISALSVRVLGSGSQDALIGGGLISQDALIGGGLTSQDALTGGGLTSQDALTGGGLTSQDALTGGGLTSRDTLLCALLDLLEALSASRLRHGVCVSAQRLPFTHARALLQLTTATLDHHAKKRALLLLKRSILGRAGEDWALGGDGPQDDPALKEDMMKMADAVLQEVEAGWLKNAPVKTQASFFGGNCDMDGTQRDDVIRRAVSMILLKSLEIRTQSPPSTGAEGHIDVGQYLSELVCFLRCHMTDHMTHGCRCIADACSQQDDDMIEAAKILINLYLHQKSVTVPHSSVCVYGLNPHCHFLHLLECVSFDHSVLLDFLISDETCFLEYSVLYLKLLGQDWSGLCSAARHNPTGSDPPAQAPPTVSAGSDVRAEGAVRLVDYGSSDESEGECVVDECVCVSGKVFVCLMELKSSVSRLHQSGLFPYNPSSLLKLINTIERNEERGRVT